MSLFDQSKWQYYLPQHWLSRGIGLLANSESVFLKNTFIDWFIKRYQVDLSEAAIEDPHAFESFNRFFTRALKPGARCIDPIVNQLVSPADGQLSEFGQITADRLLQAKGHDYSLLALLAGDQAMADIFVDGHFCTVYLAPRDYHRVHMPFAGKLVKMTHVPGQLFSVNSQTASDIPNLFARNERVICYFDTSFGKMAVILVGAMVVASIATVWHGQVTPVQSRLQSWHYDAVESITLAKGAEIGRFYLGSTAIVLTPKQVLEFSPKLELAQGLKMGQAMATVGNS